MHSNLAVVQQANTCESLLRLLNRLLDACRFHALTSTREAEHAGADVVKESESPLMSSLLYPGLQALDEQYLDVDFQFGGVDQVSCAMI